MIYLVGSGPGDPGLFTLKGVRCMQEADAVVYDRLAPRALLGYAKPDAEKIYVGKKPGNPTISQEEINHLLVEKGRSGMTVVRLKGGDPYIFGRGGEEALALQEAGVPGSAADQVDHRSTPADVRRKSPPRPGNRSERQLNPPSTFLNSDISSSMSS